MTDLAKLDALIAEHVHYSNAANMRAASALIPDLIKATYEAITGTPYDEALAASDARLPITGEVPAPAPSAAEWIVANPNADVAYQPAAATSDVFVEVPDQMVEDAKETPAPVVEVPAPVAEEVAPVAEVPAPVDETAETVEDAPSGEEAKGRKPRAK